MSEINNVWGQETQRRQGRTENNQDRMGLRGTSVGRGVHEDGRRERSKTRILKEKGVISDRKIVHDRKSEDSGNSSMGTGRKESKS